MMQTPFVKKLMNIFKTFMQKRENVNTTTRFVQSHQFEVPEEPENPIPQKQQILAIPNYNEVPTDHAFDNNIELSDQEIVNIIQECKAENHQLMMAQQISTNSSCTTKQVVGKKQPKTTFISKLSHW